MLEDYHFDLTDNFFYISEIFLFIFTSSINDLTSLSIMEKHSGDLNAYVTIYADFSSNAAVQLSTKLFQL